MSISIEQETLLTLSQASHRCPNRPNISTLYRWFKSGVGGVRLETVKIGGRRYTSQEALGRFVKRLSSQSEGTDAIRKCSQQKNVEDMLDSFGI